MKTNLKLTFLLIIGLFVMNQGVFASSSEEDDLDSMLGGDSKKAEDMVESHDAWSKAGSPKELICTIVKPKAKGGMLYKFNMKFDQDTSLGLTLGKYKDNSDGRKNLAHMYFWMKAKDPCEVTFGGKAYNVEKDDNCLFRFQTGKTLGELPPGAEWGISGFVWAFSGKEKITVEDMMSNFPMHYGEIYYK